MTEVSIRHGTAAGADSRINVYFNGDMATVRSTLLPGQIRRFGEKDLLGGVRSIHIKNTGTATIAAGDIEVLAQKLPIDQPTLVRETYRRIQTKKEANRTW